MSHAATIEMPRESPKDASAPVIAQHAATLKALPFSDTRDFEEAARGFLGTIENAKEATDPNTMAVVGPSSGGNKVIGGRSRKISAGDVVIVPPNVPHGWSEVSEELVYLVVRMDPKKVLKPK